jgi:hypothetical protein
LLGQGRTGAANQRHYHRQDYHHRYLGWHLLLSFPLEKGTVSALASPSRNYRLAH